MTSKSEIKRQVIQRGGTMDDAQRIIDAQDDGYRHANSCSNQNPGFPWVEAKNCSCQNNVTKLHWNGLLIGDFSIIPSKKGKVSIYYKTGEGGEFSAAELEKTISTFFWERF